MLPPLPFPPEILFSIRPATFAALFSACGYPPGITPDALPRTKLSLVVSSLSSPTADLPTGLWRALVTVASFATPGARVHVYNAAAALAYPSRWPEATSPADLVAELVAAAAAGDDAVQEILDGASILRDREFRPRATQVYQGRAGVDPDVGEPTQYEAAFREALAAFCAERDFGAVVEVRSHLREGRLVYEILHEDRTFTDLVVTAEAPLAPSQLATEERRPVRSHLVEYAPRKRRLSITTDALEAMTPLATMAGRIFFGDTRHFLDEQAVDLWKLQELGAGALAIPALSSRVSVSAIGGTWHSGKNHAMTPRGRDLFEALARYKIRIEGGRLDLVTLRAKMTTEGAAAQANAEAGMPPQCDVSVRPPHLLTVSEPEHAPLMHDFLDRAKITNPAPRQRDFFSLQPWNDPREAWVSQEGEAGFADLVARGLLNADPANRSIAPPDHPHAGRTATAYRLRGDKFLALSPDATIAPFIVREQELVVYTLSFEKLAAMVADALGLEGAATTLDDDGVLYCGRRTLGPTHVLLFLLTRPVRPATIARLSEAAEHGHAVLILPEGRIEPQALRQLPMPKLSAPWRPLLATLVRALKLESFVETVIYAPADARVVLHRATLRVWIDGVLCAALTEIHFRVFEYLIVNPAAPAHTKDIAAHISGDHQHEDTTRKAVDALPLAIERCFKASKKKPPKDLHALIGKPRRGYYTLTVKGFVD